MQCPHFVHHQCILGWCVINDFVHLLSLKISCSFHYRERNSHYYYYFFGTGLLSRNAEAMESSTNCSKSCAGNESHNRAFDATMGTQDVRMHPHWSQCANGRDQGFRLSVAEQHSCLELMVERETIMGLGWGRGQYPFLEKLILAWSKLFFSWKVMFFLLITHLQKYTSFNVCSRRRSDQLS